MAKIILNVDGMHCAACSLTVERALEKVSGVENASVNLTGANALVNYDESAVEINQLISAVDNAGFKASLPHKGEKSETSKNDEKKTRFAAVRLIVSAVFGAVLFYVAMGHMLKLPMPSAIDPMVNPASNAFCQLILCVPVLVCGFEFFKNAVVAAIHKNVNMDTLVAIGSSASFLYSVYSLVKILGGNADYVHQLYFDSAGMIITFILIGRYLESVTKKRTNSAVEKLIGLAPSTAFVIRDGAEIEVPTSSLKIDDTVVLRPGGCVAVDGIVVSGNCTVDESMLTGESMPVDKKEGDMLYGGTVNRNGSAKYRVTSALEDSTPARIAQFINEAQATKAPIASLANKIASVFVPVVMIIAVASFALWLAAGYDFSFALKIFVCILVIACPCSLGLATPTALTVSMGMCASKGILIKNGEALQRMSAVDTVVFDKTGTLTKGKPEVQDFVTFGDFDKTKALEYFYSVENLSEHPLAQAVCEFAKARNINLIACNDFESATGLGVLCKVNTDTVYCGSLKLMKDKNIDVSATAAFYNSSVSEGKTVVLLAVNGKLIAAVSIADAVRNESLEAIRMLKNLGIKTAMLTGDNEKTARFIASVAGVDEVYAELMPDDKMRIVNRLKLNGRVVAMVGDGINDAPSLTAADVGIAVGSGTDIAIEAADIVLLNSDIKNVASSAAISKRTMRIIKQNLFWAFAYNCICIPVAAGVLFLFGGPLLSPMIAAAAMSFSSVTVVTNSLRLKRSKL